MKELTQDDLAAGLLVTVTRGPVRKVFPSPFCGGTATEVHEVEDRSGQGAALRIVAVDLPFIVVQEIGRAPLLSRPRAMDTRLYTFASVSPEFVGALGAPAPANTGGTQP